MSAYDSEMGYVKTFLELLKHPRCYFRDHLPGHLTASSLIMNEERSRVFMIYHAKLKKWLQPGGHADGDEDLYRVAKKEVLEETGLSDLKLLTPSIFDIDIHPIPARDEFPEHLHFDIRFAFEAKEDDRFVSNHESIQLGWKYLDELDTMLESNSSIGRMILKAVRL